MQNKMFSAGIITWDWLHRQPIFRLISFPHGGGAAGWAGWAMAHPKFWLGGSQCIWRTQYLACMFVSCSSVKLVKQQITAFCGFQPIEFLPAPVSHNHKVYIIVTAHCSEFLTYLLSCVENDVIVDCRPQIWPTQKFFWRGAPPYRSPPSSENMRWGKP